MANIIPTGKQVQLIEAAFSGKYSFILFGGAVGGAKTFGLYLLFLLAHRVYPGIQVIFVRKDLATISRNSYATWNELVYNFGRPESMAHDRRNNSTNPHIEMKNGAKLIFFGENYEKDKELMRWSGLVPNWFLADEINELQYKSYLKMYERAGRYQLKGNQPRPLIVATCNPSQGWVKDEIYDKHKQGILPAHILYIPSKVTDNPNLSPAYIENLKTLPPYEYQVYVEGNWDISLKTGGEFYKSFEINKHIKPVNYNSETTIHVVVDNNVLPYIAISIWQVIGKKRVQIHEIPAKDPNNIASKAGQLVVNYLKDLEYENTVFIYGDQTTTSRNTIDPNKKSFLDLFCENISKHYSIQKRIPTSNPPVALSGDFVNAIFEVNYDGLEIIINEQCKESLNDYIITKQDRDGGVLKKRITDPKTGASYEPNGHFVDLVRYFITQTCKDSFERFKRRFDPDQERHVIGDKFKDMSF